MVIDGAMMNSVDRSHARRVITTAPRQSTCPFGVIVETTKYIEGVGNSTRSRDAYWCEPKNPSVAISAKTNAGRFSRTEGVGARLNRTPAARPF